MFFDLSVPVPPISSRPGPSQGPSKKGKEKQQANAASVVYTPAQISAIENRLDLLVHLGYTVFAFNQSVQRKVDPKNHVNVLDPLLAQLRKREGVALLKRLTIVLDEESEKGFGLTNQNTALFASYDLLALLPTTLGTFSQACLTHTQPSPLTTHIIALPLTLPRLPFHLKHTLVRTALKNGAVFEIAYAGALGSESDVSGGSGEGSASARRNWWAAAREVVRVTKGKGILVSGGVVNDADLRAPRDVANLITVLGLAQNIAHDASTKVPQSLILRAQTRRTYRAVLSEPKVVIPGAVVPESASQPPTLPPPTIDANILSDPTMSTPPATISQPQQSDASEVGGKKRTRDESQGAGAPLNKAAADDEKDGSGRKRKKKKLKEGNF
ncbi:uncharacterized protein FIBRA_07511 [Fibroporia radiculosa]|uniref:PHP domain-like protein n=1 Tax=Fibroporia radiculosa TaxID=599839 RepID=J4I0T4_9APHY|nr:uncharacterized protein FIBRA_07511 [Fibroporia radiculosa]CCM05297.1 predicted protein [Fibroporia radiculosa]